MISNLHKVQQQYDFMQEIAKRYGRIKRARGAYLYTEKGFRLVDLYQEGGKAILGWGFGKSRQELKNALERGAIGSFDTIYEKKLLGALKKLFPQYEQFRLYKSKEKLFLIGGENFAIWKPWANTETLTTEKPPLLLINSVFPWAEEIFIVAFNNTEREMPKSDFFAPPLLAALARSFYDLIAELPKRTEEQWKIYDAILLAYWQRNGAYLTPCIDEKQYKNFFLHCLDNRIFISPFYEIPSIVPFSVDKGNFTVLQKNKFKLEE